MQNGPSRELFELWAPDSRNGLIITGYSIEGTLARVSGRSAVLSYLSTMLSAIGVLCRATMDIFFHSHTVLS
jgi:Cft2 family RNA processing exonuclease